jgi:F420-0:gamma-glutamyl ligase
VRRAANGEEVAVLVVDTQGMFDNETSMGLTACIFGLSTLISSHQIYNVEKRIQVSQLVCCSADSIIALPATLLLPRHAIASSS